MSDSISSSSSTSDISFISANNLLPMLAFPDVLMVDVRAEAAYQKGHLINAIALGISPVLWRRFLKQSERAGALDEFLIAEGNQALKQTKRASAMMIVLYDDKSRDVSSLSPTDPLRVLSRYLALENLPVCILEGGYQEALATAPSMITVSSPSKLTHQRDEVPSPSSSRKRLAPSTELNYIQGFLGIGCERIANNVDMLRREGITHVLNLTTRDCHPEVMSSGQFRWKRIELRDSLSENLLLHLKEALEFIDDARSRQGRILVHCVAGISRSVAVSIAYLMWSQRIPLAEASEIVQTHRECASPNLNFMGQLIMFGKCLSLDDAAKLIPTENHPFPLSSVCREAVSCLEAISVP